MCSSWNGAKIRGSGSRYSSSGIAFWSMVMNTNPAHSSARTWTRARSSSERGTNSSRSSTSLTDPSRFHRQPWNGQMNEPIRPRPQASRVPRCRQALWYALAGSLDGRTTRMEWDPISYSTKLPTFCSSSVLQAISQVLVNSFSNSSLRNSGSRSRVLGTKARPSRYFSGTISGATSPSNQGVLPRNGAWLRSWGSSTWDTGITLLHYSFLAESRACGGGIDPREPPRRWLPELHDLHEVAELGSHVEVAEADLAVVTELLPAPAARLDDGGCLIKVIDRETNMVQCGRLAWPDRVPVQADCAMDRADDLQIGRARVDQRDVDAPLVGRHAVYHHERASRCARADRGPAASERRRVALDARACAHRRLEEGGRRVDVVRHVPELHEVAEQVTQGSH